MSTEKIKNEDQSFDINRFKSMLPYVSNCTLLSLYLDHHKQNNPDKKLPNQLSEFLSKNEMKKLLEQEEKELPASKPNPCKIITRTKRTDSRSLGSERRPLNRPSDTMASKRELGKVLRDRTKKLFQAKMLVQDVVDDLEYVVRDWEKLKERERDYEDALLTRLAKKYPGLEDFLIKRRKSEYAAAKDPNQISPRKSYVIRKFDEPRNEIGVKEGKVLPKSSHSPGGLADKTREEERVKREAAAKKVIMDEAGANLVKELRLEDTNNTTDATTVGSKHKRQSDNDKHPTPSRKVVNKEEGKMNAKAGASNPSHRHRNNAIYMSNAMHSHSRHQRSKGEEKDKVAAVKGPPKPESPTPRNTPKSDYKGTDKVNNASPTTPPPTAFMPKGDKLGGRSSLPPTHVTATKTTLTTDLSNVEMPPPSTRPEIRAPPPPLQQPAAPRLRYNPPRPMGPPPGQQGLVPRRPMPPRFLQNQNIKDVPGTRPRIQGTQGVERPPNLGKPKQPSPILGKTKKDLAKPSKSFFARIFKS